MKISKIAQNILPSLTLSITNRAKEMKKQGKDIVSFAAGEPDFDTMTNIKQAAKKAIDEGFTKYTATSGIIELKEAIIKKLYQDNNLKYSPSQTIISNGTKQALFNIVASIIDKDDEVIIPVPYWVSYVEIVKLCQGKPVFLKTNNFKIIVSDLEKIITKNTKLLILNSPNNPTGVVYDEKELKEIAKICVKHNIAVISDEIYEKLIYGKKHISIASFGKEIYKLTIVINGFSKTYAMTGWRLGYAVGPEEIIKSASKIQDHTTSNPCSISQKAALEALTGPQDHIPKMVFEYKRRRDFMVDFLNRIEGVYALRPDGAFYVFADVSKLYNKEINNSFKFCEKLLEDAYVAAIPGSAFGDDRYIRLSFATSMDNIKRGLERFSKFCQKLI
ncbi:MAG: pyridoxal phosphate-dependent aminotransferase [Patescibacteria group bacterium]|nr:pyridoxal phosphate-dependent aminotransferase [Patescibacteria group bacterium]